MIILNAKKVRSQTLSLSESEGLELAHLERLEELGCVRLEASVEKSIMLYRS